MKIRAIRQGVASSTFQIRRNFPNSIGAAIMPRRRMITLFTISMLLCSTPLEADLVTVVDPSFEALTLSDGAFSPTAIYG
ncbi:MAG: hypothetical protein ACI8T1_002432 [Verrucomicrobiales bacterium]